MIFGSRALGERMGSPRINHKVERLSQFYQPVDQQLGSLVVDVIVARAMNHE